MIIVDIETSGLNPRKHGIIELAALKFESPSRFYRSFCKLDEEDEIDSKALEVNGQSVEEVRDLNRYSQKQVLSEFFEWLRKEKDFYAGGENVGIFDLNFIKTRAEKYGLDFPLHHRNFDLQTLAQTRHEQIYGNFLIEDGKSNMGLTNSLNFCGLPDKRGKHNALEDAKLEAECISRLLYGKGLFPEYNKFPIPYSLKKRRNDNL